MELVNQVWKKMSLVTSGKHTYGLEFVKTHWGSTSKVNIGSFCSIASNCNIYLGGNHRPDWVTTFPFGHTAHKTFGQFLNPGHPKSNGHVTIGSDVWIADNVTIMSGIHIGHGSVIAANSHVVKNVEPYSIVGGNPARLIRKRFSDEIISKLLKIQWWNWDDGKIQTEIPLLCSENISQFVFKHDT